MPVGAELAPHVQPSLERARELAREGGVVPLQRTFVADTETPVSAFLKLRDSEPAFMLESAEQGRHVGRWTFLGVRPRTTLRWSLGDPRRPVRDRRRRRRAPPPAAGVAPALAAAVRRRRGRLLRLRPRAHRRAAGPAEPGPGRAAGHGADAVRRARGLRPPQAARHGDRQPLRRRGGRRRRRVRARGRRDRGRADKARRDRSPSSPRAPRRATTAGRTSRAT